jgi:RNA polymerase sigma-70 factor (ECF subfamily)
MEKDKLKAFNEIYNVYYRKCFLFAKSYVHNVEIAEDFAMEAMVKLWENYQVSDNVLNIYAFLLTVVKNLSLNYLQHERTKWEVHETILDASQRELDLRISTLEACDPSILFSTDVRAIFDQTLASLPEQTRNVFNLSRVEAKSTKEIAQQLDMSIKGVDYHIGKSLKVLRVNLKDYLPSLFFLV